MWRCFSFGVFTKAALVACTLVTSLPLSEANSNSMPGEVILTKLFPPKYPPLARQTRITGDVELTIEVRQDGSIESATAVRGHPLLKQAALDSAQQSQFDCQACSETLTSYSLVYTFQLVGVNDCCKSAGGSTDRGQPSEQIPRVMQSPNHVTLVDQPVCICDPAFTVSWKKVRSAKCLYLWKCGLAR
jgi:TonB family protein